MHTLQPHATQDAALGKATEIGKGSKKHPTNEGTTKNAMAQPAPAQELVKASRQASKRPWQKEGSTQAGREGGEDTGCRRTEAGGPEGEGAHSPW